MTDDVLADRRLATEEDYFRRRDMELIEAARRRAARDAVRQRISQRVGLADDDALQALEGLGFSEHTVSLIHLVPLVHMAWVEGAVSKRMRQYVIDVAREQGIEPSSDANRQLEEWLAGNPPSDALFEETLHVIGLMLQQRSPDEREHYLQRLLADCAAIASASGGALGIGRVSSAERSLLRHIRYTLDHPPPGPRVI